MPTIGVNVAARGHSINGGTDTSRAGHMWITMPDGEGSDGTTYDPGYFTQDKLHDLQDFFADPDAHGFGTDTIYNYDTQAGSVDVARFGNVSVEDLWFSRSGNNLQITVAGTDDQVTVRNWYGNWYYQLDSIEVGASALLNNQVDQLVSAMAAYSVPSGAGNVIPQDVKDELQPVIAATWQTTW